ncbi:hypothetical protein F511_37176 [Dorcoceras hygrometricum]|uniref:Uncharacterized protein n=1 Tax=Dorcoceras hygrometricum TaxID=472368 RepID=A0A2Z7D5E1_9LAMI|nr:hypothetical protein F511_37176 [Dorcoceras hygrometricum]
MSQSETRNNWHGQRAAQRPTDRATGARLKRRPCSIGRATCVAIARWGAAMRGGEKGLISHVWFVEEVELRVTDAVDTLSGHDRLWITKLHQFSKGLFFRGGGDGYGG